MKVQPEQPSLDEIENNAFEQIAKLVEDRTTAHQVISVNGEAVSMIASRSAQIVSLEEYLPKPRRQQIRPRFLAADHFCAYVNDYSGGGSAMIFASRDKSTVTAHLDYPAPGDTSHMDHDAVLVCTRSDDWTKWLQSNKKPMGQVEFAEFLDEMHHTISDPAPAYISELAMKFEVTSTSRFESRGSRTDGSFSLVYSDEKETKGTLKFPEKIELELRPIEYGEVVSVLAHLRYRIQEGGSLKFHYVLQQVDRIADEAFQKVCSQVANATATTVYLAP